MGVSTDPREVGGGGGGALDYWYWDNANIGETSFPTIGSNQRLPFNSFTTDVFLTELPDGWTLVTDGNGDHLVIPRGVYSVSVALGTDGADIAGFEAYVQTSDTENGGGVAYGHTELASLLSASLSGTFICMGDDNQFYVNLSTVGADGAYATVHIVRIGDAPVGPAAPA